MVYIRSITNRADKYNEMPAPFFIQFYPTLVTTVPSGVTTLVRALRV